MLHRLEELVKYLGETALQLEHCPVAEDLQGLLAAHIAGKGKSIALVTEVGVAQVLALAFAVVVPAAVRSWLLRLGTTAPTLPGWPPGSAVEVAGLEPLIEVEGYTTAGSCMLLVPEARERQHMGPLAVMVRRRALANLHYCCLHKR